MGIFMCAVFDYYLKYFTLNLTIISAKKMPFSSELPFLFSLFLCPRALNLSCPLISVTHFSARVCCSLIPTLNRTGCTRSSIPFWISRGRVSNIAPGIGTLTLKPFLFPVITGSMSGPKPEVAWVTLKVTFLRSITPTLMSSSMASSSPLRNKTSSQRYVQ